MSVSPTSGFGSSLLSTQDAISTEVTRTMEKMREGLASGEAFVHIDDMRPDEIIRLDTAKSKIATTLKEKSDRALVAVEKMRDSIIEVHGKVAAYNKDTMNPQKMSELKSLIKNALVVMGYQLNSTYSNGYVFGAGKDDTIKPVNASIITEVGNLAPDGSASDMFVLDNAKSADRITNITESTTVDTSIDANDPAFVNIIGAMWGVLNVLDAANGVQANLPAALPANTVSMFTNGMQCLDSLVSSIKGKSDLAEESIQENNSDQDKAKQSVEDLLKFNTTQIVSKLRSLKQIMEIIYSIEIGWEDASSKITAMLGRAASAA
jgi:hypothetical protein